MCAILDAIENLRNLIMNPERTLKKKHKVLEKSKGKILNLMGENGHLLLYFSSLGNALNI